MTITSHICHKSPINNGYLWNKNTMKIVLCLNTIYLVLCDGWGVSSLGRGIPNDVTSKLVLTQNELRNECSHNL